MGGWVCQNFWVGGFPPPPPPLPPRVGHCGGLWVSAGQGILPVERHLPMVVGCMGVWVGVHYTPPPPRPLGHLCVCGLATNLGGWVPRITPSPVVTINPGRTWPTVRATALIRVDPTQSYETRKPRGSIGKARECSEGWKRRTSRARKLGVEHTATCQGRKGLSSERPIGVTSQQLSTEASFHTGRGGGFGMGKNLSGKI